MLEFNQNEPIYIQIKRYLERRILAGEYGLGDKMMSVRELAGELMVNPNTVQRVYSELEGDDLIYTKRGIGKFVTENREVVSKLRRESSKDLVKGFLKEIKELGFTKEDVVEACNTFYEEV